MREMDYISDFACECIHLYTGSLRQRKLCCVPVQRTCQHACILWQGVVYKAMLLVTISECKSRVEMWRLHQSAILHLSVLSSLRVCNESWHACAFKPSCFLITYSPLFLLIFHNFFVCLCCTEKLQYRCLHDFYQGPPHHPIALTKKEKTP